MTATRNALFRAIRSNEMMMTCLWLLVPRSVLGPARLLRHDDLIHPEHGAHRLHGELQRPPLHEEDIRDGLLRREVDPLRLRGDVHARFRLPGRVRGVQVVHHVRGVQARVLGERPRDDLERLGEFFNRVLVQPGLLASVGG
eukprot:31036-Pelagococcus_subviridis.AAC.3